MFFQPKHITIQELIRQCKANEPKAQELLYKQFAGKMLGVCMRYAIDRMEAEDMLQNGFIRVFQKIGGYREEGSFEGWVRRIIVHSAIECYRKHYKLLHVVATEESATEISVNAAAAANLNAQDLMALIQQLSPGYRMVFNLYAIEGYSHREISQMLGITEGASKSQLSRARGILKEQLEKMEGKHYAYAR